MSQEKLSLYAAGDVVLRPESSESIFSPAAATLKEPDILFGHIDFVASSQPPQMHFSSVPPSNPGSVSALRDAGFDIVSVASNHGMDYGEGCFLDNIDLLKKSGIAVIGGGKDGNEARRPVIIERNGARVGFLGYCSVLPRGYEAKAGKPGIAPMRASTSYEQVDWQPGMPPRVLSAAHKEDLAAMLEDIKKARLLADVLVLSLHWGLHYIPSSIAMYQKEIGHAAIDAGVDVILGHHALLLKGIEVYKGKVIFYGLGNFAVDSRSVEAVRKSDALWKFLRWEMDPGPPPYAYPPVSRKAILAKCLISGKKITRVSYLPVMANKQLQPEVLLRSDQRSAEVFDYMEWLCRDQELDTKFAREGDEVVIHV
ncbi:MAG: CapA family protein [Chloroflexi bacterium]|nr:CapA family protein [Chloroflexota bacterium]